MFIYSLRCLYADQCSTAVSSINCTAFSKTVPKNNDTFCKFLHYLSNIKLSMITVLKKLTFKRSHSNTRQNLTNNILNKSVKNVFNQHRSIKLETNYSLLNMQWQQTYKTIYL